MPSLPWFHRLRSANSASLKTLAGEKGILFGSAVGAGASGTLTGSFADARYLSILKRGMCRARAGERAEELCHRRRARRTQFRAR